jgi:hypothetical protein
MEKSLLGAGLTAAARAAFGMVAAIAGGAAGWSRARVRLMGQAMIVSRSILAAIQADSSALCKRSTPCRSTQAGPAASWSSRDRNPM